MDSPSQDLTPVGRWHSIRTPYPLDAFSVSPPSMLSVSRLPPNEFIDTPLIGSYLRRDVVGVL